MLRKPLQQFLLAYYQNVLLNLNVLFYYFQLICIRSKLLRFNSAPFFAVIVPFSTVSSSCNLSLNVLLISFHLPRLLAVLLRLTNAVIIVSSDNVQFPSVAFLMNCILLLRLPTVPTSLQCTPFNQYLSALVILLVSCYRT